MKDGYCDDLSDFIRNGKLDAYELTDEELARLLELWRWSMWRGHSRPSGPDYDIVDAVSCWQQQMTRQHGVEVDYNTLLLLRQELEPLMYLRVLWNVPHVLAYFLNPHNWLSLGRVLRRVLRYRRIEPVVDGNGDGGGYPRRLLDRFHEPPPDLLRRAYWRQIGGGTHPRRRHHRYW